MKIQKGLGLTQVARNDKSDVVRTSASGPWNLENGSYWASKHSSSPLSNACFGFTPHLLAPPQQVSMVTSLWIFFYLVNHWGLKRLTCPRSTMEEAEITGHIWISGYPLLLMDMDLLTPRAPRGRR